jgi:Tfp pilus tip-associated adhesin PilY1
MKNLDISCNQKPTEGKTKQDQTWSMNSNEHQNCSGSSSIHSNRSLQNMQYKELIEKDGSLLKSIKYDFIKKKRKKKGSHSFNATYVIQLKKMYILHT